MEHEYTYSIASDTANAKVDSPKLVSEVEAAAIVPDLDRIDTEGDVLKVVFGSELSASEETTLDGVVGAHDGEPVPIDKSPMEVRTRMERNDISMRLCRAKADTSSGTATVTFRVPGTAGNLKSREIEGGMASFGSRCIGDYIETIKVKDTLNLFGYGAGFVLKEWSDEAITNFQDGGLWLRDDAWTEIHAMGDWGELPAQVDLEIVVKKKAGEAEDTAYVDIIWGVPS